MKFSSLLSVQVMDELKHLAGKKNAPGQEANHGAKMFFMGGFYRNSLPELLFDGC
ncbi:MAG TPA: hypothetical protein VJ974_02810 [Geopsychrobacteraceae bacterium]|nr:hypothetical protein [Geopsychrobacteraceae bacterium]